MALNLEFETLRETREELTEAREAQQNALAAGTRAYEVTYGDNRGVTPVAPPVRSAEAVKTLENLRNRGFDPFHELGRVVVPSGKGKITIKRSLKEALLSDPTAYVLLRDGVRFIAMSQYASTPMTWSQIAGTTTSDRESEVYVRDSGLGRLPRIETGLPMPELVSNLEGATTITNYSYGGVVTVSYEDIRFDRVGKVQQLARVMGRAAAITEENNVYEQVVTSANYTSTAANGRNDVGANFIAATTLTAATFETALATIATAKDPNGSAYLNCRADTIIIGPRSEQQVKKFLMSDLMQGAGGTDATERGNMNPYKGLIKKVIVSPYFSDSYDWALADTSQLGIWGLQFQEVDAPQVLESDRSAANTDWMINRQVRYGVYMLHGVGFIDSRAWYYSTSSTAPTL